MTFVRLSRLSVVGLALTLLIAGCAHRSDDPASLVTALKERPTEALRALKLIGEAEDYAHDAHVEPVTREKLRAGCIAAWPQGLPRPASVQQNDLLAALGSLPSVEARRARDDCLRGMMRTLDALSHYVSPAEWKAEQAGLGDPGLELGGDGGLIRNVVPGSPADDAGVAPGDRLVEINGQPVTNESPAELRTRLRGEPASRVTLGLLRGSDGRRIDVEVTRQRSDFPGVRAELVAPGVHLVRVARLHAATPRELVQAHAKAMKDQNGELRGMVLDLRDNSGGVLTSTTEIATLLLPERAVIVELRGRQPSQQVLKAEPSRGRGNFGPLTSALHAEMRRVPMAVLVNQRTNAGAEVIAAALQDHGRARVIGARSGGHGSIQTLRPLGGEDGVSFISVTTARAHRPNGAPIAAGVAPDIVVEAARPIGGSSPADDPAVAAALLALTR
jgi:carboxyl-terminal processing protease